MLRTPEDSVGWRGTELARSNDGTPLSSGRLAMNRWTDRLTFAALFTAALLLTPATFAQTRGDGQPRTGQAQPRSGQSEDDKKSADQEKKKRADQDKKRDDDRAEARRQEDDRRRAEEQRRRNLPRPERVVF